MYRSACGAPLDPWLRTHWRLGGRIIATAPASQTMTGTVSEWEGWADLAFPSTGEYVIPGGLSTLHIDRENDHGRYVEPTSGCDTSKRPERRRPGREGSWASIQVLARWTRSVRV